MQLHYYKGVDYTHITKTCTLEERRVKYLGLATSMYERLTSLYISPMWSEVTPQALAESLNVAIIDDFDDIIDRIDPIYRATFARHVLTSVLTMQSYVVDDLVHILDFEATALSNPFNAPPEVVIGLLLKVEYEMNGEYPEDEGFYTPAHSNITYNGVTYGAMVGETDTLITVVDAISDIKITMLQPSYWAVSVQKAVTEYLDRLPHSEREGPLLVTRHPDHEGVDDLTELLPLITPNDGPGFTVHRNTYGFVKV